MENKLPVKQNRGIKPLSIVLILIAIVVIVAAFTVYKKNQVNTSLPKQAPAARSLNIPGYQLSLQGTVSEVSSSFLKIKEKDTSFPNQETKVFVDSNTAVYEKDISIPSKQSTKSGILVSYPLPKQKTSLDKVKTGDNVQINLDEKDSKLFVKEITVVKTQVSSR